MCVHVGVVCVCACPVCVCVCVCIHVGITCVCVGMEVTCMCVCHSHNHTGQVPKETINMHSRGGSRKQDRGCLSSGVHWKVVVCVDTRETFWLCSFKLGHVPN